MYGLVCAIYVLYTIFSQTKYSISYIWKLERKESEGIRSRLVMLFEDFGTCSFAFWDLLGVMLRPGCKSYYDFSVGKTR
jgi:hypothetical protein